MDQFPLWSTIWFLFHLNTVYEEQESNGNGELAQEFSQDKQGELLLVQTISVVFFHCHLSIALSFCMQSRNT